MHSRTAGLRALLGIALALSVVLPSPAMSKSIASVQSPVDAVNPFVGTDDHGHTYPGATVPFGMVQLSPDTGTKGWDWCSGYHWSDNSILGFSHTHLSGTGCPDLGDVLLMPTTGAITLDPGTKEHPETGYRSSFTHQAESASPGYYSVDLKKYAVKAELTATNRVGVHRYTFPKTTEANVVIDLAHGIGDKPLDGELSIVDNRTVTGMRASRGWAKKQVVYFVAEFSKPFQTFGTTDGDGKALVGSKHAQGKATKGWVTFDTSDGQPVVVKVALSNASLDGARRNLQAEVADFDFDKVHQKARAAWATHLDRVAVNGGEPAERQTFYTALYHSLLAPTTMSDVDGQFRAADGEVHKTTADASYSTFSLWDTFRAEHPLFTVLAPERVDGMINSFKDQADFNAEHKLPIWPLYNWETDCMIGYHSFPVISEAYLKGHRNWDASAVFDRMVENTKRNDWWADKGYMPADKEKESVSKTLEFAYDDWALAQFAKALGKHAEYEKYMRRAQAYKQLFDPSTGFMRGRLSDGSWRAPFDPTEVTADDSKKDFCEGDSWHYTFFVPHDVSGLVALMGGRDAFVKKLDAMFEHAPVDNHGACHDVSGCIGQYAQGNEPSHHVAYLYDYAGAPWKTQDRVRTIRDTMYSNKPSGLCGNEDCGQMSAWYVFSALGFYPVNPVQGTYVFGVPQFPQVSIMLPHDKSLQVVATNLSPANKYIDHVVFNGQKLDRVYLKHEELMAGGRLEFVMATTPNKSWACGPDAAPLSMSDELKHLSCGR